METIEFKDLPVSDIMKRWPETMRLFIDRRLLCVGCPMASFHTLTNVAAEHDVDRDDLVAAVLAIANADETKVARASGHRRSGRAGAGRRP